MLDLAVVFEDNDDEFLQTDAIDPSRRLHQRHDIDAFLRLHNLVPGERGMVAASEHDEYYLDTDVEELAKRATVEDIVDLIRCGVMYDANAKSLRMFS